MEEHIECIICYEEIDKNIGDYISDICDTCKYYVHISCHEKYISSKYQFSHINKYDTYCLICRKFNLKYSSVILENSDRDIHHNILIRNTRTRRVTGLITIGIISLILIIFIGAYSFKK
jgi:hypothetical protein